MPDNEPDIARPTRSPAETAQVASSLLAILVGVFTGFSCFMEAFTDPRLRWVAWFVSAALFFYSAFREPRWHRSAERNEKGLFEERPNHLWRVWLSIGCVFVAILAADILYETTAVPLDHNPIRKFEGGMTGFTEGPASKNLLLTRNVGNVSGTGYEIDLPGVSGFPFYAETLIQRRYGTKCVLVQDMLVKVVEYAPMPPFYPQAAGAGEYEQIEAYFTLRTKAAEASEVAPWDAHLEAVFRNRELANFHIPIEDFTVRALRYYIAADDPGIYWVRVYVKASAGRGFPQTIELTRDPIPVAFYNDDEAFEVEGDFEPFIEDGLTHPFDERLKPHEKPLPPNRAKVEQEIAYQIASRKKQLEFLAQVDGGVLVPYPATSENQLRQTLSFRRQDIGNADERIRYLKEVLAGLDEKPGQQPSAAEQD